VYEKHHLQGYAVKIQMMSPVFLLFFKGLQMALPSFLQDANGDRFWELI